MQRFLITRIEPIREEIQRHLLFGRKFCAISKLRYVRSCIFSLKVLGSLQNVKLKGVRGRLIWGLVGLRQTLTKGLWLGKDDCLREMIAHGSLPRIPSSGSSCNPPQTLLLRGEGTRDEAQRTSAWDATQHGRFGCNREKLDVIVFHYPVDSTRFSWPNHDYIARMAVIQWNPDFLTTLGKVDQGSNYWEVSKIEGKITGPFI